MIVAALAADDVAGILISAALAAFLIWSLLRRERS